MKKCGLYGQTLVKAGTKDLFIDMLFYHLKLRCYVVVELKACEFEAGFIGQLGAYVSAVNHQMRDKADNARIFFIRLSGS